MPQVLKAFCFPSHQQHYEIVVCKYTWRTHADILLKYFWAGPSGQSDDKRFPCRPIISFVSVVCHRSHAAHNDPRLRVVSPDLAVMLTASICLAALDCVDIANTMVTKHMEAGGSVVLFPGCNVRDNFQFGRLGC